MKTLKDFEKFTIEEAIKNLSSETLEFAQDMERKLRKEVRNERKS